MRVGKKRVVLDKKGVPDVVLKPVSWLANIDFVAQLIVANNVLISCVGEQGGGKTTFATLLQKELSSRINSHLITANALFDRTFFLQQLGILLENDSDLSLAGFVEQSDAKEAHTLVIIDDAHYLSIDFIEEILCALKQQRSHCYFHVCFVSESSIVPALNKLAQDKFVDMLHSIELGALSENETKAYVIQNVLTLPGADNLITDERVKQFYQLTEGHIEKINHQVVDFFCYKPSRMINRMKVFGLMGIVASVFLLAITGVVYFGLSQGTESPPAQLVHVELQPLPEQVLHVPPLKSDIPTYYVAATRQALAVTSLRQMELPASESTDESLVVTDKVVVAPKTLKPRSGIRVAAVKKSTPSSTKQRVKASVIKPVIEQSRFTIQLLASRNVNTLKQFVEIHHLNGKTKVRRTQHQGDMWYVLTLGEYSQRQYAKQAVSHLPKDIAQFKPWVRLMTDLT